ncbi:ammonium transporter [Skermania sp. ID1734]|uniref:ammonium transporter n=1 Tax=Skermania sp. ID1734 TaxID=2597516 RepID=UPI00117E24AA|nr:ammonium transporter [Skermania sp. ID1734]TSD94473.1 ammonium transporter [Skermania sp. ID1734]
MKYELNRVGNSIVASLDHGTFALENNNRSIAVRDGNGKDLVVFPLSYNVADRSYPIDQSITDKGTVIRLTPVTDAARSVAAPELHPVASNMENQRAMGDFQTKLGLATAAGALGGLLVGAGIGCGIGLFGAIIGCLPGAVIGAPIGAVIGIIAAGGPTLIVAGVDLINTLNAPPGTTRWMH